LNSTILLSADKNYPSEVCRVHRIFCKNSSPTKQFIIVNFLNNFWPLYFNSFSGLIHTSNSIIFFSTDLFYHENLIDLCFFYIECLVKNDVCRLLIVKHHQINNLYFSLSFFSSSLIRFCLFFKIKNECNLWIVANWLNNKKKKNTKAFAWSS